MSYASFSRTNTIYMHLVDGLKTGKTPSEIIDLISGINKYDTLTKYHWGKLIEFVKYPRDEYKHLLKKKTSRELIRLAKEKQKAALIS